MELSRTVVRVEGRNLTFFGTERKGTMTVTHVVDQSRGKMYSFRHEGFMGKKATEPFDCSERRKMLSAARRKYGIASALCFEHYRCTIETTPDENGDNAIAITDVRNKADILQEFAEKHWELSV